MDNFFIKHNMNISIIVAVTENNAIGKDNDLVCFLPNDMKFFKEKTTGHHILMGRKNFLSIGKVLPNRTNLIVSRDTDFKVSGAYTFNNINDAVKFADKGSEDELIVIGGGNIYEQVLPITNRIYLTLIHTEIEGDTYFPTLDTNEWNIVSEKYHGSDVKHPYSFTFLEYKRKM